MVSGTTPVNALNLKIARRLDEVAQVLSEQGANPYRVQAYRNAASSLRCLVRPVDVILNEAGEPGLRKIPGIGQLLICLAG
jgi:DNA polymerase/3'-5' exonuclease PolX